jgi:hypothetical protein
MDKIINDTNKKTYKNNDCMLFIQKSTRKNAKCELLNIMHLISKDEKLSDERITSYFIDILEKCLYIFKKYNKKIICHNITSIYKETRYKSANQDIYITAENITISDGLNTLYSFESFINYLYNIFFLIYPYNTINLKELYNNSSIQYFINDFYNN